MIIEINELKLKFKNSTFWLGGDFNLPDIKWPEQNISGSMYTKELNEAFIDMLNNLGIEQMVDFPTRKDNILDLFCTNQPALITKIKSIPGISDHDIVLVDAICKPQRSKQSQHKIYLWKKVDIKKIKDITSHFISELISQANENLNIDQLWNKFKEGSNKIIDDNLVSQCKIDKTLLPPKKLFGNQNETFIKKRQTELEIYLQTVLFYMTHKIASPLAAFLEFHNYEIHGITQTMAEDLYNKVQNYIHRLNNFEQKFSNVDTEIITCKERISVLEHSAEFMSDIKDEHKSIKAKIQTLTKSFEVSKTTSNSVKERLAGVEAQNLSNNLLFFAIEEKIVNVEMETNGAQGNVDEGNIGEGKKNIQENCLDIILDFCEQTLKIENAKANLKLEKAYRLGKKKVGESRPRPIVVKFSKYGDREMVRKSSKRLKGSDFGISPQYPQEVLAKRKKLIPVMLEKRKEKKTAYLVGDKLFVEGVLYDE
ncbi:Hypothetical predicted protein [Mytilus galloprovincialis]|uniref:Endonuclease/exonuclease/phosphatase domain-containing protein n=1 Tax=Mytilus galloprovincialis TaxID=29158 RepID=A0A8B6F309_MYTGA|nr:Hypothetical predicted protein [Mytilus galloprovincialis]